MGIKVAHETKEYDGIWVMDDDGVPDKDCLKYLSQEIKTGFVSPLVLNIDDHNETAFPYLKEKTYQEIQSTYSTIGKIQNYATPFNAILFSRKFIDKVGYPKKEMFIWGDEVEYQNRAVSMGFEPVTVIKALHYHPKDRMVKYKDCFGNESIVYVESKLRRYCKYRNTSYCIKKYSYHYPLSYLLYGFMYFFYYIISRKCDLKGLKLFIGASVDGFRENFNKHKQYL